MAENGLSIKDRLAILEGASIRVPQMVHNLYGDYTSLSQCLVDGQKDLAEARKKELETAQALKDAKAAYEKEEAAMLATDERAGGKNDTERKRNATNLIMQERSGDGSLGKLWSAAERCERMAQVATMEREVALDYLSAVRYAAMMCAGLGQAIGG